MTVDEAYAEMKKRGWGFAWNLGDKIIGVGPISNGIVEVLGMDKDPIKAVEKAIENETGSQKDSQPHSL